VFVHQDAPRAQGKTLWGAFAQKQILLPAAFLVLWQASASPGRAALES
jgi:hypothetical protein